MCLMRQKKPAVQKKLEVQEKQKELEQILVEAGGEVEELLQFSPRPAAQLFRPLFLLLKIR